MKTGPKSSRKAKPVLLQVDDTLKERSGNTPLFAKKIERATQIMALARSKQAEQQPIE